MEKKTDENILNNMKQEKHNPYNQIIEVYGRKVDLSKAGYWLTPIEKAAMRKLAEMRSAEFRKMIAKAKADGDPLFND